jgi:hypothetical protein
MLLGKKKKSTQFLAAISAALSTPREKKEQLGSGTKFGKIWMILVTDGHMNQT